MKRFLKRLNLVVLFVLGILAIALSAARFVGLSVGSAATPAAVLFLLGAAVLHLTLAHISDEEFKDFTRDRFVQLAGRVDRLPVRVFGGAEEAETYLASRLGQAKHSICDLSWKDKISAGFDAANRQRTHELMDRAIGRVSESIAYREIFVFSDPRRVARLEKRLSKRRKGYSCSYFRAEDSIPRLQFVLIDDEEVVFFASAADSLLCSVRSGELCKVLRSYYDASWSQARPIKLGSQLHEEEVEFIRRNYPCSAPKTRKRGQPRAS